MSLRRDDDLKGRLIRLVRSLAVSHGTLSSPVDPLAYAGWVDARVTVRYVSTLAGGASLSRTTDGYLIQVDRALSYLTARFRIAHEVAHILSLEGGLALAAENRAGGPMVERACDEAAAEMLMPSLLVHGFAKRNRASIRALQSTSDEFAVSYQAAAIQLIRFGWKCVVMLLRSTRAHSRANELRVAWSVVPRGSGIEIPRDEPLPPIGSLRGWLAGTDRSGSRRMINLGREAQPTSPPRAIVDIGNLATLGPKPIDTARVQSGILVVVRLT